MQPITATNARNEWSCLVDSVVREKPAFIKRTRDYMVLTDARTLETLLEPYSFTAALYREDDGSVTLSLDQIDIVENGSTEQEAIDKLSSAILEYAEDFYSDFSFWARGERKKHIPYVIKALLINDPSMIGGKVTCRHGEI